MGHGGIFPPKAARAVILSQPRRGSHTTMSRGALRGAVRASTGGYKETKFHSARKGIGIGDVGGLATIEQRNPASGGEMLLCGRVGVISKGVEKLETRLQEDEKSEDRITELEEELAKGSKGILI